MFNVGILFLMRSISLINSANYNYDKHGTYSHKVYRICIITHRIKIMERDLGQNMEMGWTQMAMD